MSSRRGSDSAPELLNDLVDRAVDGQRINLEITKRENQKRAVWNATQILDGVIDAAGSTIELPAKFFADIADTTKKFVEAAGNLRKWCLVRLYLHPGGDPTNPRTNGLILEWRDGGTPISEAILMDNFLAGRWQGRTRIRSMAYAKHARHLTAAARNLHALVQPLNAEYAVRLVIRTFAGRDVSVESRRAQALT